MKKLIVFFATLGLSGLVLAAEPLLAPAELNDLLSNTAVRVIDVRDAKSYAAQHIPGAVSAPYGAWRGPASNPGELPPLSKLTSLVQSLGLTPETHAVVVSSGIDPTDFGSSARVYWTLKVLGLKQLSILNGGMKAWTAASLPQNDTVANVKASSYAPQLDSSLIATRSEVASDVSSGKVNLVDARPSKFFLGETRHQAAKLPGTLRGAVNLENDKWFKSGSSSFVSIDDAKKVAASSAVDPNKETVSFCNTGHWAATNWFAMSEVLGQENVKLYPGSMVDWTQASEALPMDHVPSRGKQLLIDAKLWTDKILK